MSPWLEIILAAGAVILMVGLDGRLPRFQVVALHAAKQRQQALLSGAVRALRFFRCDAHPGVYREPSSRCSSGVAQ